jgi:hypothetical protein
MAAIHDPVRRNIGESFNGGWHDGAGRPASAQTHPVGAALKS